MTEHRLEFLASENPWSPTAALAEINERTGAGLELIGLADQAGGTSSAAYVRWPDGRECALTRTHISLDWMRRSGEVLSALASKGLPVPRHELVLDLADGRLAVVQELLPGHPPSRVDRSMLNAMVATNARLAGMLADFPDLPAPRCSLRSDRTNDRRMHRTLESHSPRGRRLSRRILEIGRAVRTPMTGDDLVHPDFGLGNILFDADNRVTGVVDWNWGVCRGDHRFALVKLAINIAYEGEQYGVEPEAVDRLDAVLGTIDPDLLRLYWAGWMLHDTHFAIQFGNSGRMDQALALAERHLA